MTMNNPSVKVKVTRRRRLPYLCDNCKSPVETSQSRIYNKHEQVYTCFNFYVCDVCEFDFKENPVIVLEYEKYPRLGENLFEDYETEVTLPLNLHGDIVNVEFLGIKNG